MTDKLTLTGITKSFGRKQVLRGVDLSVPAGENLVILGGSGSGKSVLLKCILGLLTPDAGTVEIDGKTIGARDDAVLSRFGMLFQGGALFDSLTVWQNVSFRLRQGRHRLSNADAKELAVEKLRRVGLTPDVADLLPAELSGGMQKRVGLARAIAAEPEIIFFDEPTTGLDPIMAGVINELIREVTADLGATGITITHDMTSMRAVGDRVALMLQGKVHWTGPVAQVETCGDAHVTQFVSGRATGPIETVR